MRKPEKVIKFMLSIFVNEPIGTEDMSTVLKGQQQVKVGTGRSSEQEGLYIISHYHIDRSLVLKSIQVLYYIPVPFTLRNHVIGRRNERGEDEILRGPQKLT